MKHVELKEGEFNDFGCPETEMRSFRFLFESHPEYSHLNFTMKNDAPHYTSAETRIAYTNWESYGVQVG